MREVEFDKHLVIYDEYNIDQKPELQEFLESEKIKAILNNFKDDIIMVLGGDGTILRAIRKHYKEEKAFLPINFGTKGFLLNNKDFVEENSDFVKREYPLMDVKVETGEDFIEDVAFNEFAIKDIDLQMVDLDIRVNEANHMNVKGDGLLISTPAGATGYNSSLHGPILPHSSKSFTMPFMAAWEPKLKSPVLIENYSVINIQNTGRINSVVVGVDGNVMLRTSPNQKVEITIKKSKSKVNLLIPEDYIKEWDNKVLKEQGFNN